MDEYYQILGLPVGADSVQIKRAYRQLAMRYHPDVNPSVNAQEKFLSIKEAYEVLLGIRKVRQSTLYRTAAKASPAYTFNPRQYRESFARERANRMRYSRERPGRRAQMDYEAFIRNNDNFQKAWYFRPVQLLVFLIALVGIAFGCFLIISPFLVGYYLHLNGSNWWLGFMCVPLIAAGVQVVYQSIRLKKETAPYFARNSGS